MAAVNTVSRNNGSRLILGEENGFDVFPMLKKYCADKKNTMPPVLVCSAIADSFKLQTALKLGAAGFLSKTGGKAELLKAIDEILHGKVYVYDDLSVKLTDEKQRLSARFTKQEIRVIDLIKANKTNQQIADELFISIRTVRTTRTRFISRLGF